MNLSVSKSLAKAAGCPRFFALSHLSGGALTTQSRPAEAGTDFHRYRRGYVDHLIATGKHSDQEWIMGRLEALQIGEWALPLVLDDMETFSIDPRKVFAAELFLSVDEQFRPLDMRIGGTPGERPEAALAHGTIDLLSVHGAEAVIDDYKTGWGAMDEYEALHYATLVFAHFPWVEAVRFDWEFIRARAPKSVSFQRGDMEWMQAQVIAARRHIGSIIDAFGRAEEMPVNPNAGLCGFCTFTCPLRADVAKGTLDIGPLQTTEDARALALRLKAGKSWVSKAEDALRTYLQNAGKVDLGGGMAAELVPGERTEFAMDKVLRLFGFGDLPTVSPDWDIPLGSLTVSSAKLKSFAKAKKRAGMPEALRVIAKITPAFTLKLNGDNDAECSP